MRSPFQNLVARFKNNDETGQVNPSFEIDEEHEEPIKEISANSVSLEEGEKAKGTTDREQWSNPIEFLLSCIAMSVGLGNVWRFPFTAYENGGGAFLIPYIIILVFVGKPLYYMELVMGQFASAGSVRVWDVVPIFRGIGYGQAFATWCVVTYYVPLMALTVYYFFASFFPVLPWSDCGGNENCFDANTNVSTINLKTVQSASEYYFEEEVWQIHHRGLDDGIFAPEWRLTLCLLLCWIILFLILVKGVKSSGKSAYFTAIFPYVVLFILLGRGASLPGAAKGILFFITPKWEKLLEPKVWFSAVGQSFFSLSVGFGSIIMYSSYNDFRHNVYRDAHIISIVDTLTSLLAGITIFAILGHLADELGVEVEQVVKSGGSGLAFISYPDVLARFDWAPQLFAVLFFLMLFTLGVGSASALTACIITIICDEFPRFKKYAVTLAVCAAGFFLGLFYVTPQGQFILDLVDHYGANFVLFILAFFEVAALHWIYGMKNFIRDIEFMLGRKTGIYWRFCWAVFIPLLLLVIFIYTIASGGELKSGDYVFKSGAHAFGIVLTLAAVSFIPVFFIISFYKAHRSVDEETSLLSAFKSYFKASRKWGPREVGLRRKYEEFIQEREEENFVAAQDYLGVEGIIRKTPYFHFKRIMVEIKYYILEVFWND